MTTPNTLTPGHAELLGRLGDDEDQFVERKLEGAGAHVFKRTLVAFANSVPPNRTAVLFVGVDNEGEPQGVRDPDQLQRTLRHLAENECYPPIYLDLSALKLDAKSVIAAVVSSSASRPHFAGPAYVRRGSETIKATDTIYRDLLLAQDDRRRFLLDHRDAIWTVELLNKSPGAAQPLFDTQARSRAECRIEEVTAFFVRLRNIASGTTFTEMLDDIHITYDDQQQRHKLVVWPVGRT